MIGLHRAIELRVVSVNAAVALGPRRLPGLQLFRPLDPRIEHRAHVIERHLRGGKFGEFDEETAGFGVDFDVAHEICIGVFGLQFFHERFDLLTLGGDLREIFGLDLNRGRPASAAAGASGRGRRCARWRLLRK